MLDCKHQDSQREAAVAQARDPFLPAEQCRWWYWSRQRKAAAREGSESL